MPDWKNLIRDRLEPLGFGGYGRVGSRYEEFAQHLEDRYRELR